MARGGCRDAVDPDGDRLLMIFARAFWSIPETLRHFSLDSVKTDPDRSKMLALHSLFNPSRSACAMSMSFAEAAALRKALQRSNKSRAVSRLRSTATDSELPRPPPKSMPKPETFESVARPGAYYERPRIKRDLPIVTVSFQARVCILRGLTGAKNYSSRRGWVSSHSDSLV